MLPKKERVTTKEFPEVLKGRVIHSPFVYMRVVASENKNEDSKIAFVVPKKTASHAVDRNKLRRRGYAAVRGQKIRPGLIIAFFLKKGSLEQSFQSLKKEIQDLISHLN